MVFQLSSQTEIDSLA
jgi:calcium-dependent protein kinase